MVQLIDHPPIYLNPVTPYFNSTMVQLIEHPSIVIYAWFSYFNSTMVQLIVVIKLRQKYL